LTVLEYFISTQNSATMRAVVFPPDVIGHDIDEVGFRGVGSIQRDPWTEEKSDEECACSLHHFVVSGGSF
jgi:hypothetical protein